MIVVIIINDLYCHISECIDKFGPTLGEEVWEATNKVFDTMPVAAVIDSKVSISIVLICNCTVVS